MSGFCERRDLPLGLLVAHPLVCEDQVDRPLTEGLVGQLQIAYPRVLRFGCHATSIEGLDAEPRLTP